MQCQPPASICKP